MFNMGLATWPAATLIKKICPIGRHLTNQGRGGGVFLRKILSTFVLLSVLLKEGNGHFLSLWSMHGPACDIFMIYVTQ